MSSPPLPPDRPFGPGAALLLLLVYFAANAVVLLIGDTLSDGPVGIVFFAAAAVIAPLAAVYVGLLRHAPEESTASALRLVWPSRQAWLQLGLALVLGVALSPLAMDLTERLVAILPKEDTLDEASVEWLAALQVPATQVLLTVAAVLLIPVTREVLLRGLVLPRLAGVVSSRRAVTLVVLLDLVTQPFPEEGPRAIVAAVPLCLLALASRTTWAPIVAHVALVAAPIGIGALFGDSPPLPIVVGGSVLAVAAVALSWRLRVSPPPAA